MPIATRGGSIGLNPTVKIAHELLGHPGAQTLAKIIVSVGLAQNFAAVKALTSTEYSGRTHEIASQIISTSCWCH